MATTKLRPRQAARRGLVAVSALAVVGILAGCSSAPSSASDGSPSGTLNIVVSSADASDAGFAAINKGFQKEYPEVDVKFSAVPNNNYNAAKSSRLTAGNVDILIAAPLEVPKYVTTDSASDDSRAADAGVFLDLTEEKFLENYTPSLLESIAYKGKQFTIPTGVSYYSGVFYNKTKFDELGLGIPTTWTEFVAVATALQESGIAPIGIGGKDSWPAGLTMISAVQGLYPQESDKQELAENLWKQKATLTDDKTEQVLGRVEELFGFAQPNFSGVPYAAIPAGFANGEFAMTADGTWSEATIKSAVGANFEYGYFPIPTSETAADNATLAGKVDLRLAVASSTKNKTAALAWMEYFSQPENYTEYVAASGTAPAQQEIPTTPFIDSIRGYTAEFSPAWDTLWIPNAKSGAAASFPFNYPGIAPLGSGTAESAAKKAQSDWSAGF